MLDIQNTRDTREVPLMKVGVSDLSYPVKVLDKLKGTQMTTALVNLYVNLPQHFKGTHMSRFIEIFHRHHENLGMKQFLSMLEEIRTSLEAERSFGAISFPFFIEKEAPVSREKGIMSYQCGWEGEAYEGGSRFFVTVSVPVTTVCPCSKAISDRGAHNQRGIVSVKIESKSLFWIEDVIQLVEQSASSGLYSVLKRPDEKFVTESAYDNPCFVEDVVREVYIALRDFKQCDKGFSWFSVECRNFESIHNHNAYAYTEFTRLPDGGCR